MTAQRDVINAPGGEDLVEDGEEEGGGIAIRSLLSRMMASPCFCTGVRTEYLARRTFSRRTVARPELGKSRTGEGLFSPTIWQGWVRTWQKKRLARNPGLLGQEPRSP